jgi:16S rRNA U516 pseudouridylate synthase RsuA-like enzyme
MKAALYDFTLIQGKRRHVRRILAFSTFEATCTGLNMVRIAAAPVRIICKPLGRSYEQNS